MRRQEVERLLPLLLDLRPITAFTERVSIGGRYNCAKTFAEVAHPLGDPDTTVGDRDSVRHGISS